MHGLYHYFTDARLREIYADLVVMIDGWWILAILKAHGYPVNLGNRMAWIDFIWPLLTFAERRRFRVFWLGNSPAVNEQGLRQIGERLPSLMIAGHHGYFDHCSAATTARSWRASTISALTSASSGWGRHFRNCG